MSLILALIVILRFGTSAFAQSGRRKAVPAATPTPEVKPAPSPTPSLPARSMVTAEKDQDYRCTDDGSLAQLLDRDEAGGFSEKEVDQKAEVTARPDAV